MRRDFVEDLCPVTFGVKLKKQFGKNIMILTVRHGVGNELDYFAASGAGRLAINGRTINS